jgi:hypothetical protein
MQHVSWPDPQLAILLPWIAQFLVAAALLLALTVRLNWWSQVGFAAPPLAATLRLAWFPVLVSAAYWWPGALGIARELIPVQIHGAAAWTWVVVLALLTGFTEEVAFRGIALRALSGMGPGAAAAWTAVLFAALHVPHTLYGASAQGTAWQAAGAGCLGVLYAALRLRTGSLWPVVALHALKDFLADALGGLTADPGPVEVWYAISLAGTFVAYLAYGVALLVPRRRRVLFGLALAALFFVFLRSLSLWSAWSTWSAPSR